VTCSPVDEADDIDGDGKRFIGDGDVDDNAGNGHRRGKEEK